MILRDPANTQPIADIAARVGIPSAAQFSRMFHHHYGRIPRDLRPRHQTSTHTELTAGDSAAPRGTAATAVPEPSAGGAADYPLVSPTASSPRSSWRPNAPPHPSGASR